MNKITWRETFYYIEIIVAVLHKKSGTQKTFVLVKMR